MVVIILADIPSRYRNNLLINSKGFSLISIQERDKRFEEYATRRKDISSFNFPNDRYDSAKIHETYFVSRYIGGMKIRWTRNNESKNESIDFIDHR